MTVYIGNSPLKRRWFAVAALAAVSLVALTNCDDSDDADQQPIYAVQQPQAAQDMVVPAATPVQAQAAPQPVIVNNVPAQSGDHLSMMDYLMLHHIMGGSRNTVQLVSHDAPSSAYVNRSNRNTSSSRTVVNNVTNVYHAPAAAPVAKPVTISPRSYTVSAPSASAMKSRTWSTSTAKGWGSSTSYSAKPSYSSRSSTSSFRSSSSSFAGRR